MEDKIIIEIKKEDEVLYNSLKNLKDKDRIKLLTQTLELQDEVVKIEGTFHGMPDFDNYLKEIKNKTKEELTKLKEELTKKIIERVGFIREDGLLVDYTNGPRNDLIYINEENDITCAVYFKHCLDIVEKVLTNK